MEKMNIVAKRTAENLTAAFEVARENTTVVTVVKYLNLAIGIENIAPEYVLGLARWGFVNEVSPHSIDGYREEILGYAIDNDGYVSVATCRKGFGDGCFPVYEECEFKRS